MKSHQIFIGMLAFVSTFSRAESGEESDLRPLVFPRNFSFGVSSSAYQTEGAWNEGGRGESIWDRMIHTNPDTIKHRFNADEAVRSYDLYERDLETLAELGVQSYRFSISWPRLMPSGRPGSLNDIGVRHYDKFIDRLLATGIEPMVTLYHWDLPQVLEEEGGFLNDSFPLVFEEYAKVAFELYGDRVKKWVTFNEPYEICVEGYGGLLRAPMKNLHGRGEYRCLTNLLTANARAYRLYDAKFRPRQKGIVGYAIGAQLAVRLFDTEQDREATEDAQQFFTGILTHAIFSKTGGYPEAVIRRVSPDRLVNFTDPEYVRGTADFLGVNHYDVFYVTRNFSQTEHPMPSFASDVNVEWIDVRRWSEEWLKKGTSGFGKLLRWLQRECNDPLMYVTESGIASGPGLDDIHRVWYYRRYALEILRAIRDGVKIGGYSPWSLMDNFEWLRGYTERYGFYQVDFDHVNKTRTPRRSAFAYKHMAETKSVDVDHLNDIAWNNGPEVPYLSKYKFKPEFDFRPPSQRGIRRKPNQTDVDYAIEVMESQIIKHNKPFQPQYMHLVERLNGAKGENS